MKKYLHNMLRGLSVTVIMLLICGLGFPLLLTGISSVIMPRQAKGNIIEVNGEAVGSQFVGQDFTEDYFFKCRPSSVNYNTYTLDAEGNKVNKDGSPFTGPASGSYNYGASNPALKERIEKDIDEFLEENPGINREDLPPDLFTASGSGLDPHISRKAAEVQLPAVSAASGISEDELNEIIGRNTTGKFLGVFGEETVNVLLCNIEIAQQMELI